MKIIGGLLSLLLSIVTVITYLFYISNLADSGLFLLLLIITLCFQNIWIGFTAIINSGRHILNFEDFNVVCDEQAELLKDKEFWMTLYHNYKSSKEGETQKTSYYK